MLCVQYDETFEKRNTWKPKHRTAICYDYIEDWVRLAGCKSMASQPISRQGLSLSLSNMKFNSWTAYLFANNCTNNVVHCVSNWFICFGNFYQVPFSSSSSHFGRCEKESEGVKTVGFQCQHQRQLEHFCWRNIGGTCVGSTKPQLTFVDLMVIQHEKS